MYKSYSSSIRYSFFTIVSALLAVFIYLSWSSPLISDDYTHFIYADYLNHLPTIQEIFGRKWIAGAQTWAYRPVLGLFYFVEKNMHGHNPGYMRFFNLIIHLLNCYLFHHFLKKNFQLKKISSIVFIFICLFHPVAWHSIIYISARSTLLVTSLIIAGLLNLRQLNRSLFFLCVFFILGLGVKATIVNLLVFFFLWHFILNMKSLKQHILLFSIVLVFLFITLLLMKKPFFMTYFNGIFNNYSSALKHDLLSYIRTEFFIFLVYLKQFFFPLHWSFYYHVNFIKSLWSLKFLIGFMSFFLIGVYSFFQSFKKKEYILVLLALTSFLPEFLYPRELLMNDQRLYLPLFFIFGFLSCTCFHITKIYSKVTFLLVIIFSFVCLYSSFKRVITYQAIDKILDRDIHLNSENANARALKGVLQLRKGEYANAQKNFENSLSFYQGNRESKWFRGESEKVYQQLIRLYLSTKKFNLAQKLINDCRKFSKQAFCLYFEGIFYNSTNQFQKAYDSLSKLRLSAYNANEYIKSLLYLNRLEDAVEIIDKFESKLSEDYLFVLNKSLYLLKSNKKSEATLLLDMNIKKFQERGMPEYRILKEFREKYYSN